jgi:cysteate synthase
MLNVQHLPGMWRFLDWLPVSGTLPEIGSGPVTYRSRGLAREIGLEELYVSFNGYWPEREAEMLTCSFKELEALPTMRRMRERGSEETFVVASAGNTGRAFAYVASLVGVKAIIVIPTCSQDRIWVPDIEPEGVHGVAVEGDYYDAIRFADVLAGRPGFVPEGGARNIARRDGMGTVMLDATLAMGTLPRHYFQAVGSGTGGISAYEASRRLSTDGRFGAALPVLHLAQSIPCAPLYHARLGGSYPPSCPKGVYDDVLFNRRPPYSMPGGVGEALDATGGEVVGVTNSEAAEAQRVFEGSEGIDILPAPAVAVAALIKAVAQGRVEHGDRCLLNITGGGLARLREDHTMERIRKDLLVVPGQEREGLEQVNELLEAS